MADGRAGRRLKEAEVVPEGTPRERGSSVSVPVVQPELQTSATLTCIYILLPLSTLDDPLDGSVHKD